MKLKKINIIASNVLEEVNLKLLLLSGVFFLILGFVSLVFSSQYHELISNKMMESLDGIPIAIILVQILFLVPIIEELIFRLGLIYKKKYHVFFGILILMFLFIKTTSIIIPIVFIGLFSSLFLLRKSKNLYYNVLILLSSLSFAFIHMENFGSFKIIHLLPIVLFFGGSQLIAYVRIKFAFKYAILFHILWNGLIFVPSLIAPENIEVSNTQYTISLTKENIFNIDAVGSLSTEVNDGHYIFQNVSLPQIFVMFVDRQFNEFYIYNDMVKYNGEIKLKGDKQHIDFIHLIKDLKLEIDTLNTLSYGYEVFIMPTSAIINEREILLEERYKTTLYNSLKTILKELSEVEGVPIKYGNIAKKDLSRRYEVNIYRNLSFEDNLYLIGKQCDIRFGFKNEEIESIKYFIKR